MTFPFSIKYSARLNGNFDNNKRQGALEFIQEFIAKKTGDEIVIEDGRLSFKSKFFKWGRWNTNILVPIERGVFIIKNEDDKTILTYEFFMYHLFIIVITMSIFMGVVSEQVWFGIICFLWLGGVNWLIAIIRHKIMLAEIAKEIEILIAKSIEGEQGGRL